jgi:hypothetical protein
MIPRIIKKTRGMARYQLDDPGFEDRQGQKSASSVSLVLKLVMTP